MKKQTYKELDNDDFDIEAEYSQICDKCNTNNKVLSQKDNNPEYYTIVMTFCQCGNEIKWKLPVN